MDIKTIIFGLFLINLYLGIFTYFIKISQPKFKNFSYWIAGNLLIAFGYLFLGLRDKIPDFLSIVIANSLFIFAALVRAYGFKELFNVPTKKNVIYLLAAGSVVFMGVYSYFTYFDENIVVRILLVNSVLSAISVYAGILVIKNISPSNRLIYNITAGTYFFFSLVFIVRISAWIAVPMFRGIYFNSFFNYLQFASCLLIDITWTVLFLFISFQRTTAKQLLSEEKFRYIAENTSDGILTFDADNKISYASPSYFNQLGFGLDEKLGQNAENLYYNIHPDDSKQLQSKISEAIALKEPNLIYEYRVKNRAGQYIWREDSAKFTYDNFKNYSGAFVICRDITARKKVQQALAESEAKFKSIIENLTDIYYRVDAQGQIIMVSPSSLETFGYASMDEVIGRPLEIIYRQPEERKEFLEILIKNGKVRNYRTTLLKKDGTEVHVETTANIIFDTSGSYSGVEGIVRDITDRYTSEQIIKQQNSELKRLNADKDLFMQILAHDLKSPFNSVLGFSELLLENFKKYDFDKIEKQLKIIHQASRTTYNLLEDLLLWSKSQTGKLNFKPQEIEFGEICNEVISNLTENAKSKNIVINFSEPKKIMLFADINMLKTVLRNLISNAIKFSNKHSQIFISIGQNHVETLITVSDSGVGIEMNNQAKLWEPSNLYTTNGTEKEKGTGLGLSLCKEFVEKHGGKIWVESEPGKGSDFKFTIPFINPEQAY